MATAREAIEEALGQATLRLAGKGFLAAGDIVSQRIPEMEAFVAVKIEPAGASTPFTWTSLAAPPTGLHHRIYLARPDVGAIASGALPWTGALGRLNLSLPAIFDEQVRHLGLEVSRLKMAATNDTPIAALSSGANAYALDDLSLCLGMGLERLTANIEILEKCAESYVVARSASAHVKRIPWLIRFIAHGRLKKDQKDAAARHMRGERAVMKAGY